MNINAIKTIEMPLEIFERLCELQAIMSSETATPTNEEFEEYCALLENLFLPKKE